MENSMMQIATTLTRMSETLESMQQAISQVVPDRGCCEEVVESNDVCNSQEEEYVPYEHYEFFEDDLTNMRLREYGYKMAAASDKRHSALDEVLTEEEAMDVLYHLYALCYLWENNHQSYGLRNSEKYVHVLKNDIDYITNKVF